MLLLLFFYCITALMSIPCMRKKRLLYWKTVNNRKTRVQSFPGSLLNEDSCFESNAYDTNEVNIMFCTNLIGHVLL